MPPKKCHASLQTNNILIFIKVQQLQEKLRQIVEVIIKNWGGCTIFQFVAQTDQIINILRAANFKKISAEGIILKRICVVLFNCY